MKPPQQIAIGLNAVIVAVTAEVPRILTVRAPGQGPSLDALPFGPLEPATDRTLDRALRRWVREQTGLGLGYVEQLYTFGDRERDPREARGGARLVSVAYLALVQERAASAAGAEWRGWYEFFPWEDWRTGRPPVLSEAIEPALERWIEGAPDAAARRDRRERADIAFGLRGVGWDGDRVLERYELLYEAGLVEEAWRDRAERERSHAAPLELLPSRPMVLDHRRILATALGRLRGKLKYRPVVFELLPPELHAAPAPASGGGPRRRSPAQAELPPAGGDRRAGRGDRPAGDGDRRPAGGAVQLPARGAARAAGARHFHRAAEVVEVG